MTISSWRVLAGMVALACAGSARLAAQFQCIDVTGDPLAVRANGVAELVAEYVVSCNGGAGGAVVLADFTLTFNTAVTSKAPAGVPEALLLLNEPSPPLQLPGVNVIQATASADNQLIFTNVPLSQPGQGQSLLLRFTNLRVNASALSASAATITAVLSSRQATITIPEHIVGTIQPSFTSRLRTREDGFFGGGPLSQCTPLNPGLAQSPAAPGDVVTFNVQFTEGAAAAFLPRLDPLFGPDFSRNPGFPRSGESGFYNPDFPSANGLNVAGLASQGTRLMAKFTGIPAGVALFVTVTPSPFGSFSVNLLFPPAPFPSSQFPIDLDGVRLTAADTNGAGPYTPITPTSTVSLNGASFGIAPLPVMNGAAAAVWEILKADPSLMDTISFGVLVAYSSQPATGGMQVTTTLAPLTTDFTAASGIVPRFTSAGASTGVVPIAACGAPLPDLHVTALSAPTHVAEGTQTAIVGTVLNDGAAAAGPFEVGYALYRDSALTQPLAITPPPTCRLPGLAVNTSASCPAVLDIPAELPPGPYYLGALADDQGQVAESNEANNTLSFPLVVDPCQYSVTPASIGVGRGASVRSVLVTTGKGCFWSFSTFDPWLTLISNAGMSGTATVTFAVAVNPNPGRRTGILSVAGHTISVTQDGVANTPSELHVYDGGAWFDDASGNHAWDGAPPDDLFVFGVDGDIPVLGDWDKSGQRWLGVYRNGLWYVDLNRDGAWDGPSGGDAIFSFGVAGDYPIIGDWDGTGKPRMGVYRAGLWYVDMNDNHQWDGTAGGDAIFSFGVPGDIPVTGDWDGSGQLRIGIYRNGLWYVDLNGNNQWDGIDGGDAIFSFGIPGDIPITGDWDGSGKLKIGIYRQGLWYVDLNGNNQWDGIGGGDAIFSFGIPTGLLRPGTPKGSMGGIPVVAPDCRCLTPAPRL